MPVKQYKPERLYFSIKEVADELGVAQSVLRFWEKQIPALKPKTTGNNVRQYSQKNVDDLKMVYNLVKVRGFKLEAARKMLAAQRGVVEEKAKTMELLQKVREGLLALKGQLDLLE